MPVRSGIVPLRSATLPVRSGIYIGSNAILIFNFILPGLTGTITAHKFMQSARSGTLSSELAMFRTSLALYQTSLAVILT